MKYSLGISNFLEKISSLSPSIDFVYFFALIAEEGFLISPCYSLELCIQMLISFLFSFAFRFPFFFTAICKASSDSHFAFLHFFFLGMILIPDQLYVYIYPSLLGLLQASSHPTPLGHHRAPIGAPCAVTAGSHWLSLLHMLVYLFQACSQFIPLSPSSLCPCVHSLHLHLYSCPANMFICTIFLDSTYMS